MKSKTLFALLVSLLLICSSLVIAAQEFELTAEDGTCFFVKVSDDMKTATLHECDDLQTKPDEKPRLSEEELEETSDLLENTLENLEKSVGAAEHKLGTAAKGVSVSEDDFEEAYDQSKSDRKVAKNVKKQAEDAKHEAVKALKDNVQKGGDGLTFSDDVKMFDGIIQKAEDVIEKIDHNLDESIGVDSDVGDILAAHENLKNNRDVLSKEVFTEEVKELIDAAEKAKKETDDKKKEADHSKLTDVAKGYETIADEIADTIKDLAREIATTVELEEEVEEKVDTHNKVLKAYDNLKGDRDVLSTEVYTEKVEELIKVAKEAKEDAEETADVAEDREGEAQDDDRINDVVTLVGVTKEAQDLATDFAKTIKVIELDDAIPKEHEKDVDERKNTHGKILNSYDDLKNNRDVLTTEVYNDQVKDLLNLAKEAKGETEGATDAAEDDIRDAEDDGRTSDAVKLSGVLKDNQNLDSELAETIEDLGLEIADPRELEDDVEEKVDTHAEILKELEDIRDLREVTPIDVYEDKIEDLRDVIEDLREDAEERVEDVESDQEDAREEGRSTDVTQLRDVLDDYRDAADQFADTIKDLDSEILVAARTDRPADTDRPGETERDGTSDRPGTTTYLGLGERCSESSECQSRICDFANLNARIKTCLARSPSTTTATDGDGTDRPATTTSPREICDDRIDNDGDRKIDCADSDCRGNVACVPTTTTTDRPATTLPAEICNDRRDNDGDRKIDCADTDCINDAACVTSEVFAEDCNNGADDSGNGLVDCDDPYCRDAAACAADIIETGITCERDDECRIYGEDWYCDNLRGECLLVDATVPTDTTETLNTGIFCERTSECQEINENYYCDRIINKCLVDVAADVTVPTDTLCVDDMELLSTINQWLTGGIGDIEILNVINSWLDPAEGC